MSKRFILVARIIALLVLLSPRTNADEGTFSSNGVPIHYWVEGAGEPVVLIHGFTGSSQQYRSMIPLLGDRYRLIAMDCRGHGKSGKPHEANKYGSEMVEDVIRLMDHLKVKKAHVLGYSMGAMITGCLLARHPDRLITATMGGAAGLRPNDAPVTLAEPTAQALDRGEGIAPIIIYLTPKGQPKPPEAMIKAIGKSIVANNDAAALAALMRGFHELTVTESQMELNKIPSLAIVGGDDPLIDIVNSWSGKMALYQIVTIPNANHASASSRPEFGRSFAAFLDSHREGQNGSLFDGRTFNGWNGDKSFWRIQDGALVGGSLATTGPHNDFIATTREFGNFDLRLKAKLTGTGFVNGGIQIRSKRAVNPEYEMVGYQADMGEGYWGALYDESRRNRVLAVPPAALLKTILKPDDWNDYRILCEGRRIRLWLNGIPTVDYTETDESIPLTGLIAFQIHGGGKSEASYKDIRLKELP